MFRAVPLPDVAVLPNAAAGCCGLLRSARRRWAAVPSALPAGARAATLRYAALAADLRPALSANSAANHHKPASSPRIFAAFTAGG